MNGDIESKEGHTLKKLYSPAPYTRTPVEPAMRSAHASPGLANVAGSCHAALTANGAGAAGTGCQYGCAHCQNQFNSKNARTVSVWMSPR